MDSKILHNIKDVPFNDRESFNNAILLLSMVKSEYYYIVGFSRPNNQIEIGFDFMDKSYGKIKETIIMDFSWSEGEIKATTQLENVIFESEKTIPFLHEHYFILKNSSISYERVFEKDDVIPLSMDKLNTIILSIKKDIEKFIVQSFTYILRKG